MEITLNKNEIWCLIAFIILFVFCFYCCWKVWQQGKLNKKFKKEYKKFALSGGIPVKKEVVDNLVKFSPDKITVNLGIIKFDFKTLANSRNVLWKVLVELSTRIIFNKLYDSEGDAKTALKSIHCCFKSIRKELKKEKLLFPMLHLILSLLNKQMRPFLAKWHGKKINKNTEKLFREELSEFKKKILNCSETKLIFLNFGIKIEVLKKVLRI